MVQALRTRTVIFAAALALTAGTVPAAEKHDHAHDHGKKSEKKHDHDHGKESEKKAEAHDHEHHDHEHTAPHGGTLVVLGGVAHVELVLDPAKGKLTAYSLDSHAEKSVRLKQPEIELAYAPADGKGTTSTVRLVGVASPLTGEQVGNTSEFSVRSDKLKGLKQFNGVLRNVTVQGNEFKNVGFRFPEGNE